MDMVCEHLNLLEKDYFGMTFADTDTQKVSGSCTTVNLTRRFSAQTRCQRKQSVFLSLVGWVGTGQR